MKTLKPDVMPPFAIVNRETYGLWSTVSKANFQTYGDNFDTGFDGLLGPWFGWFSNRLKGCPDTLQDPRKRPTSPRAFARAGAH